jgi:hypothetical protein
VRKPALVLLFAPTLVAIGAASFTARADDPKPCRASTFAFPAVESACKSGGQAAAKAVMKKAVDKGKAAGEAVNFKSCHTDLTSFALTPDAGTLLKKWL